MLRDRTETEAVATVQRYAVYDASGRFEMHDEPPTVAGLLAQFDELLEADPESSLDAGDQELMELMGLA